jgi:hypothetical protein
MNHIRTALEPDRVLAAATIFAGAFLLFEVEPLIAKEILPWFGGTTQVWITCLVFFQVALLAGYLYAHLLVRYVNRTWQARIHLILLAISLAMLPIVPSVGWKPAGAEDPMPLILGLLVSTIGLPFVLLSSTNPLVQGWLARSDTGNLRPPYRLYALSNLGSMLALLSYPTLVEPNIALRMQAVVWSVLYATFVLLAAAAAWRFRSGLVEAPAPDRGESPTLARRALWFALAAAPSALLLAMTDYMLQNIAPIPLFWIVPLALYLLSFIFAFNSLRWFVQPYWYVILALATAGLVYGMSGHDGHADIALLPLFAASLFVSCLVCHGELALSRPSPRRLTEFYLLISAGGAAGGLAVAVGAPAIFNGPYDLAILVPATILVILVAAAGHYRTWLNASWRFAGLACGVAFLVLTACGVGYFTLSGYSDSLAVARNFYGVLNVRYVPLTPVPLHELVNGNILHGQEYIMPGVRDEPISYYSRESGIGVALEELGRQGPLRVGVIGLGIGTIAAYGRPGDVYRFYEINPLVPKIARQHFWYLGDNPARTDIVMGDARLSLEREPPQKYDLLVVDAFVSDSIPIHLLTREAFQLYWRHLKPDGVLVVHVSNRFAALAPIVARAAIESGKTALLVRNKSALSGVISPAEWMLVTSRTELFDRAGFPTRSARFVEPVKRAWTDDYSDIWSVLRFRPEY